ncbi:hypothetical protein IQ07DRAFT_204486 [Pyrenochaeta sp. DS3sAY3a]|nr:hypothetical protein IQ07DRAFT_204486 [Pyrenochaeta sp. DS3sAY3a]
MFMHSCAAHRSGLAFDYFFSAAPFRSSLPISAPSTRCALFRLHSAPHTLKTPLGPVGLHSSSRNCIAPCSLLLHIISLLYHFASLTPSLVVPTPSFTDDCPLLLFATCLTRPVTCCFK